MEYYSPDYAFPRGGILKSKLVRDQAIRQVHRNMSLLCPRLVEGSIFIARLYGCKLGWGLVFIIQDLKLTPY